MLSKPQEINRKTSLNLKPHIYEHKRDLCLDNPLNSLIIHKNKTGHNFDFINVTLIKKGHNSLHQN